MSYRQHCALSKYALTYILAMKYVYTPKTYDFYSNEIINMGKFESRCHLKEER